VIDAWWLWAKTHLAPYALEPEKQLWILQILLPVIYWGYWIERTQNPRHREHYRQALLEAQIRYQADPLTTCFSLAELDRWRAWGLWMVRQFHRSSSAVEGRNGCLSYYHHVGRGLTRLAALTVIHNYGIRRDDGTTAAQRLLGVLHPDLFEWVLGQMKPLPLPRQRKSQDNTNLLNLQLVPP